MIARGLLNLEGLELSDVIAHMLLEGSVEVLRQSYTREAIAHFLREMADQIEHAPALRLVGDEPIH